MKDDNKELEYLREGLRMVDFNDRRSRSIVKTMIQAAIQTIEKRIDKEKNE